MAQGHPSARDRIVQSGRGSPAGARPEDLEGRPDEAGNGKSALRVSLRRSPATYRGRARRVRAPDTAGPRLAIPKRIRPLAPNLDGVSFAGRTPVAPVRVAAECAFEVAVSTTRRTRPMLRAVARWPKLRRNGCNRGGAPERHAGERRCCGLQPIDGRG